MKSKDVRIGMKVVPTQKTKGTAGFPTWRSASAVASAIRTGQPFMYVVGWEKESKSWMLSAGNSSRYDWSLFSSKDFYPYTGENNEI